MKKNIKKIVILSLIILYFSIGKSFANTGTVIIPAARLREKPNTESNIITNIYEDDKVNILETNGDWCKVEYDGNTGYVKKEFLKITEENKEANTTEKNNTQENTTNTETSNNQTSITNTNQVNDVQNTTAENNQIAEQSQTTNQTSTISLRVLPNITSKVIAELDKNKIINQIAEINNWVKVTDGSITGWVLKVKLSKDEVPAQETPVQETPNQPDTTKLEQEEPKKEESKQEETNVNKTGKINVETANVRESASSDAKIIEFLDYNDEVTIVAEDGDWYKIVKDGINGYVNKRLITLTVSSRSLTEPRESSQEDDTIANEEVNDLVNNALSNSQETSTNNGAEIVEFAKQYLGYSYVLGGRTPETGFDCSGFTKYVYSNFGYTLGNTAASQNNIGTEIARENLKTGDLILFYDEGKTKIGHTGIYMGDGNFIHAANASRGVVTDNLDTNSYYNTRVVSIRRIVE